MNKKPSILWKVIAGIIIFVGLILTVIRFTKGLGATTNLSDYTPWGLWIGFDVLCGVALAAGGFTITGLVYLINFKHYNSIIRPTVLTAFLGYILVSTGLIYDLGKPYNIWHPMIMWNEHSVMFEVAWCVMLYSTVLALEFSPIVFEKLGWTKPIEWIKSITLPVVIAGVILSTLHQSSLGTLFLIIPGKLYKLWYSSFLPVMFFLSAICVGIAMVIFESSLSSYFYKKSLKFNILIDLGRFLLVSLILYLVVKFQDLFIRGVVHYLFLPRIETLFFWLEILLLLIPMFLLFFLRIRISKKGLFICACMVILGVVLNRLNVSIIGLYNYTGMR